MFAREITDGLTSLVKQLDEAVKKNEEKKMAVFVVLLTDDPDAGEAKLKELAKKEGITNTPLTVFDGAAGPTSYKVAKDADVTILMWLKLKVEANHAFAKDKLDKESIAKVLEDTSKILR